MKKIVLLIAAVLSMTSCSILQRVNWNEAQLQQAMGAALTAASISEAQIIALSRESVAQLDAQNTIDNGSYAKRLAKVVSGINEVDGLVLNFKVYKTEEVNAFACGDGSIRVYSGLMDVMDDSELMAIIGHEIGHVIHQDTKRAMKNAYLTAAARGVISAAGSIGQIAKTQLGDLGELFISSQFSQKQEFAADEYGYKFSVEHGCSPYSMYNSLNKLLSLSGGAQASRVQQMFASHPDTQTRAAVMKEKADAASQK